MLVDTKKVLEKLQKIELIPWEDNDDVQLIPYDPVMLALHSPDCEVSIQPPALPASAQARIEAAIRYLRKQKGGDYCDSWDDKDLANLLAWAFGLPQGFGKVPWTDKDFGLEEKPE